MSALCLQIRNPRELLSTLLSDLHSSDTRVVVQAIDTMQRFKPEVNDQETCSVFITIGGGYCRLFDHISKATGVCKCL